MDGWVWLAIIFGALALIVILAIVSIFLEDLKKRRKSGPSHDRGGA